LDKKAFKDPVTLENDCSGSRSKAKFAVFYEGDQITFGFTTKEGSGKALETCPLHFAGINDLLPVLKNLLNKYQIIPYDLKTKRGELKYLLISKSSEEFLVRFVLRSKESMDRLRKLSLELGQKLPEVKVVTANIQPIHQAIIEGEEEIILTEQKVIIHKFDEFQLALGARSFFQVTPEIARRLYDAISKEVREDKPISLIDLYCGVGAFSFYANRWCEDVTGVEISKEAIACAKESVLINESKIDFHALDVEDYLKTNPRKFAAVLVNPPRRGLNSNIIGFIKKW
jgi:23S rRNA (uracil747-C5)-methyltransferase